MHLELLPIYASRNNRSHKNTGDVWRPCYGQTGCKHARRDSLSAAKYTDKDERGEDTYAHLVPVEPPIGAETDHQPYAKSSRTEYFLLCGIDPFAPCEEDQDETHQQNSVPSDI